MFINDKIIIALLGALIGLLPQIYKFLKERKTEKEETSVNMVTQLQQEGQAIRRELRVEIDSLKEEIKELKQQNKEQAEELDALKRENIELQSANGHLKYRVSDLENQLKAYTNNQDQG